MTFESQKSAKLYDYIEHSKATCMRPSALRPNGLFQFIAGALIGVAVAMVGQAFLHRISLPSAGLYPLATLAIALTAYSVTF